MIPNKKQKIYDASKSEQQRPWNSYTNKILTNYYDFKYVRIQLYKLYIFRS